jgi:hypothetical protein
LLLAFDVPHPGRAGWEEFVLGPKHLVLPLGHRLWMRVRGEMAGS